jgi:hypothetical protein
MKTGEAEIGPPSRWCASATMRHGESLAERMRVPCGSRTGFESYTCTLNKRRIGRLKKRVDTHRAREPIGRTFARGL